MRNLRLFIPVLLILGSAACGAEAVDQSQHGGTPIPDSMGVAPDETPAPQVPAVLEETPAS